MAGLAWVWPSSATRWRKPALVGASVAAHTVILGFLAARVLDVEPVRLPEPPAVLYVEIEPRPLLEDEQPRPRTAPPTPVTSQPAEPVAASGPARSILGFRLPFQRDREEEADRPSPPAPRLAAPAPSAAPGAPAAPPPAGGWTVRPETMGDRVGRGLRTRGPGCASPQLLSEAERAVCDDRFGERAAAAAPIAGTGNPERDARFAREGDRALAQYEARRQPLAGGVGVVGPQDGVGSNFGIGVAGAHLDQSLRPDSTTNIRTRRDGPRSSGTPLTPGSGFDRDPQR